MSEFDDRLTPTLTSGSRSSRFRLVWQVLVPLGAILFQVYLPRFIESLGYLELPLLTVVYFSLMRRQPVAGALIGASIGLVQDSLSHHPLGLFGLVDTLVGYFSASVSQRFDVQNRALRFILSFFFFIFHQFFFWLLSRALLGQVIEFNPPQTVIFAFLNAVVSIPLFLVLDRLKEEGR
jgi:rod shape-determining protein MreD